MRTVFLLALACATATTTLSPRAARAADDAPKGATSEYTVHKGDTCTSVAKQFFGGRVELFHGANPQLGPQPHHLTEGMVLHIPVVPPDARVSFVRNQVEAFTPEEHGARRDEPLMRGHRVDTEADSSAEVTFADETSLQLGEHTLVVILGARSGAAKAGTSADTTLMRGTLRAHLAELVGSDPPLAVQTPAGHKVLVQGGSDVLLSVDEGQASRLAVHRGKSSIRASGKDVSVPEGFGSKADKGKPPTPPRPLPNTPTWTSPFPRILFATTAPTVDASGTYAAGTGVGPTPAEWHVQLSHDERFNALVVDAHVAVAIDKLEARALPAGTYFARVSAVDSDHFEGKPTAAAPVTVVVAKETPAAKGQQGTLEVPPTFFCALDGEPLTQHAGGSVALTRARAHTLRCATKGDGSDATETAIPPQSIGEVRVEAALDAHDSAARTGRLVLTLRDAEGAPVKGAAVTARGSDGATIGALSETATPGVYAGTVGWVSGHTGFHASVSINGLDRAESNPVNGGEPPAAPAAPKPRSPYSGELALSAGAGSTGDNLGLGPAFAIEAGARRQLDGFSLALGLRIRYEHYEQGATGSCTPTATPLAGPCAASTASYGYDVEQHLATFELPITARLGNPDAFILPYAGVAPGVAVDRSILRTSTNGQSYQDGTSLARFTFQAFGGIQLPAGPGGFFVELGYRVSPAAQHPEGTSHLETLLNSVGYRLSL